MILLIDLLAYAAEGPSKGCLMAMIDDDLSNEIKSFAKTKISNFNLAPDGYEKNPHVTVLYGFNPDFETQPLEAFLENQKSLDFTLGAVSRFEAPDYDVLKLEINCASVHTMHHSIKKKFSDSIKNKYPAYHPHITLAYCKKGAHPELDGNQELQGKSFKSSFLVFSPPNGEQKKFQLKS